ncbi:DUF3892 domain-containing protein [Mucilaginibacter daejeonensis]|uniref:DUF3892 domain-containing protein n=1 Tax=Mucilaginibacter daejeonensis TaxID=398049 RepID=UPI00374DE3FF|nr:DUF3892 domain-containing protein [Mucilaginibacter daejeonensis]
MASYQVVCITKPNAQSSHEHITHIGYDTLFKRGIITVEEAIKRIEANSREFYVETPAGSAYVKVERPEGRRPYIRTVPDHTEKDNLLNLPQC